MAGDRVMHRAITLSSSHPTAGTSGLLRLSRGVHDGRHTVPPPPPLSPLLRVVRYGDVFQRPSPASMREWHGGRLRSGEAT